MVYAIPTYALKRMRLLCRKLPDLDLMKQKACLLFANLQHNLQPPNAPSLLSFMKKGESTSRFVDSIQRFLGFAAKSLPGLQHLENLLLV